MHHELIKAELRIRGLTLSDIARDLGVGHSAICNCVKGARSRRVEAHIAQVLERPVEEIFPERYAKKEA